LILCSQLRVVFRDFFSHSIVPFTLTNNSLRLPLTRQIAQILRLLISITSTLAYNSERHEIAHPPHGRPTNISLTLHTAVQLIYHYYQNQTHQYTHNFHRYLLFMYKTEHFTQGVKDYDFLIAFHSNFLSGMHGFRDYEVLFQAGCEVIVISPPEGAARNF